MLEVSRLKRIIGFLIFACQLVPLFRSYIRPWYRFANLPVSHRVHPDPGPLVHLWQIFIKGPLFYDWPSRVARRSVQCFVDATNSRVAGISGHGMFSFPLGLRVPSLRLNFWHLCMVFIPIYHFLKRFVLLEIIPMFCIVFKKAVREILFLIVFFRI